MQATARYLDEAGARGGLTESEIAVLGIIYAANATLFPTSALDVIPGAGKAVSKSGELIKAGIKAEDAAKVAASGIRLNVSKGTDNFVDLTTAQRRRHILDGDATGGGHRPGTGIPGKSEFPQGWSDDKIIDTISDIATDPNAARKIGRGGKTVVEGVRDGVTIQVIVGKDGQIITGFPTNLPRNPK